MQKRPIILFLLAILIVCFCFTSNEKPPILEGVFEDEVDCQISGIAYQTVKKEKSTAIYVKEVKILTLEGKSVQEKNYFCNKIIIYCIDTNLIEIGSKVLVKGTLQKFQNGSNPGQFDEKSYYKNKGISYKMLGEKAEVIENTCMPLENLLFQYKNHIKQVYTSIFSEKDLGVIKAMILGDKSSLDLNIKELYQNNGISHILAISGLHISLIGMGVFSCLRRLRCPQIPSCLITIFMCILYGIITDFSVSTKRAVIMLVIMLIGKIIGRSYDLLSALSVSGIIILLQEPGMLYDIGFLLSFGAVLGVSGVYPLLKKFGAFLLLKRTNVLGQKEKHLKEKMLICLEKFKQGILVSLSIWIITLPIMLYSFYEISLYSILVNLALLPMLSVLVFLGIISGILGCFWLELGVFLAGGAHYILLCYEQVCEWFGDFPYSILIIGKPQWWQILLYYIGLFLFCILYSLYEQRRYALFLLLLLPIFYKGSPNGLEITFLDVGQGDGIVIETANGTTFLIDGGSSNLKNVGKYRLEPYLKAKGISELDFAIVTHADKDHISGLEELIEESDKIGSIGINNLVLPKTNLKDEAFLSLLNCAKKKKIKIMYVSQGAAIREEELLITCLHPDPEYIAQSRNAYSTVLEFSYGSFKMLLTGDLEEDGENRLLSDNLLNKYNVLKVAHHGSKYSTSEKFLKQIQPDISILSCGKKNRYGHPHKELLNRLKENKSKYLQTKESGAITIYCNETSYIIEEYLK